MVPAFCQVSCVRVQSSELGFDASWLDNPQKKVNSNNFLSLTLVFAELTENFSQNTMCLRISFLKLKSLFIAAFIQTSQPYTNENTREYEKAITGYVSFSICTNILSTSSLCIRNLNMFSPASASQ